MLLPNFSHSSILFLAVLWSTIWLDTSSGVTGFSFSSSFYHSLSRRGIGIYWKPFPTAPLNHKTKIVSKTQPSSSSPSTTTYLGVATNPTVHASPNSNDNSGFKHPHRRNHVVKAKWQGARKKKHTLEAKDPVAVETAVHVALDSLIMLQQREQGDTPSILVFPSVRDCNAALSAFGDQGDLLRALGLFGKMRKAAYLQQSIKRATGMEWPVPVPTLVTYSTLMSRAVRARKPRVALRLWNMMPATIEPDVKAVNILLNCYAKLGQVDKAVQLFYDMQDDHLEPNIVTFNTVLNACQQARDLDAALDIKAEMDKISTIAADARTYTTLLSTVARRKSTAYGEKDPTVALSLLQEMYQRGVSPNGMTYSAFIEACGRCGRVDLALQGLRLMQRQKDREKEDRGQDDFVLDNEVGAWTSAINVCGKAGRWETSVRLFRSMQKLGCSPNTVTCGCLTDSLLRAGQTAEALQVLRYMKKEGIVPSEVMYTSLMTRADGLVKQENGTPHPSPLSGRKGDAADTPAMEVYTELMMSLLDASGTKSSMQSRRSRQASDNEDEDDSNTRLLRVFLVFQQMKAAGAEPDLACFNALLRACARAGDVARGMDVLRQIQTSPRGLEPNDRSWRELLRAAATARQAETAENIWNQGISYHRQRGRLVDEPERRWTPSSASLQSLMTAYMREAAVHNDNPDQQRELYQKVIQSYDDVLMGERRMGLQRIDPMGMLDDRRTIVTVLQALVAVRPLVSNSKRLLAEYKTTGRSLLQLECLVEGPPLGWSAQKAVDTLRSWDLSP